MTDQKIVTPFLKWVGGKRKQAANIAERVTAALGPSGVYYEPFLGGGAVALALPEGTQMALSDICRPLAQLWWWLQDEPEAIAEYAGGYTDEWNTEDGYATARLEHNEEPWLEDDYRPSARFLWLNHACYNGLYRENSAGQFNVPWGKRPRVSVPSKEHLVEVAERLRSAMIYTGWDFENVIDEAKAGDVVYLDPPYDGDASAFTSYSKKKFDSEEQARLFEAADGAIARGATVITTNADTPRIRALYRGWKFEEVVEDRPVAADPAARTPAHCLLITGRR